MDTFDALSAADGVAVVYDGDCPFCSRYVALAKLREAVGDVRLINARDDAALSADLRRRGYDLNDGMAVFYNGEIHYGGDATYILAALSDRRSVFSKLSAGVLGNRAVARTIYPFLRFGRNTTLRILGKSKI